MKNNLNNPGSKGTMLYLLITLIISAGIIFANINVLTAKDIARSDNQFSSNELKAVSDNSIGKAYLTLFDRIACQKKIEQIQWKYRIWPSYNPQPKPTFDSIMTKEQIEAKVYDMLQMSNALPYFWGRTISGEELQSELNRIAINTKQPEILKEIWMSLNNDPLLVAECVARPILVSKLIRDLYKSDERFSLELKKQILDELNKYGNSFQLNLIQGKHVESEYSNSHRKGPDPEFGLLYHDNNELPEEDWNHLIIKLWQDLNDKSNIKEFSIKNKEDINLHLQALPLNKLSDLKEDENRFYVVVVLGKDTDKIKVATIEWPKVTFDTWWNSIKTNFQLEIDASYNNYILPPILNVAPPCTNGSWSATSTTGAPEGRYRHTAIWTGVEMIIWGGNNGSTFFNTGGRYNPSTDSWTSVSTTDAPEARVRHSAIWNGTEMIIWGGLSCFGNSSCYLNSGGKYNLSSNTWISTATLNAPVAREGHSAVWIGSEMIIWGGSDSNYYIQTGGRYNPASDLWSATNVTGAPSGRAYHVVIWTGTEMIIWGGVRWEGGNVYLNTGALYDPITDSWTPTDASTAPAGRDLLISVWTESEMIIWGGWSGTAYLNNGGRYNPESKVWTATSLTNAPSARGYHTGTWTGTKMIIWGGFQGSYLNDGSEYDPEADSWTPIVQTGAPSPRCWEPAMRSVWTGTHIIIWGGAAQFPPNPAEYYNSGGQYCALSCANAIYNTTYGALICPRTNCCATGTLIDSRDNINDSGGGSHPEPNAPNTIFSSCFDGTNGIYHQDESIDSMLVRTTDGSYIRPGKQIVTSVETFCNRLTDYLDLYYTDILSPPSWTFLYTYQSTIDSQHTETFSHTYNIPANDGIQAIRGNFRRGGSASSCSAGITDDHDDLILTICRLLKAPTNPDPPSPLPNGSLACPSPTLSWNPVPSASTYDVWVDGAIICSDIASTSCPTTITSGSHEWYVIAKNFCAETFKGPTWKFIIANGPSVLNNNSALDADLCSDSGVEIRWSTDPTDWADAGNAGTRKYDLLRDGTVIASDISYGATMYLDTTGSNGITYSYKIRYINKCGFSTETAGASAADLIANAPSGLTNNTAMDLDTCAPTGIQITWIADPANWGDNGFGTRTYDIMRDSIPLATNLTYGMTTYIDTSGTPGTTYIYTVRYNNGCSFSATTVPGAGATDDADTIPPGNIGNTLFAAKSAPNITLNWAVATDAVMYNIYENDNPSVPFPGSWTLLSQPTVNHYDDPVLANTNNYYYIILAVDACGNKSTN